MRKTYFLLFGVGLLVELAGCAPQTGTVWDDPVYARLIENYQDIDLNVAPGDANDQPAPGTEAILSAKEALSLGDAITITVANHPRLRTAGYAVRAAEGREVQARLGPNPGFGVEAEALGASEGESGETAYVLRQEFITAGKLDKAGRVAQADQLVSRAAFNATKHELIAGVKQAFYAVLAAERRVAARRELADLAAQLLQATEARVEAGAAIEPDRLRAQVAHEQARLALRTADAELEAARKTLSVAMGLDAPLAIPLAGDLESLLAFPSQADVLQRVLAWNSRLQAARHSRERARRAHELAKAEAWPNITAFAGPRYSDIDGESTLDAGVVLEIPLINRNQGAIAEALAERLRAGASLGQTQLELIEATSQAWIAYDLARTVVETYREVLLPKTRRTLELTERAYRSGKLDYLRLLDAQQVFVETNVIYLDALLGLHQAAAALESLMEIELGELNAKDTFIQPTNTKEVSP